MRRHQIAAAIELNFYDESILMFGAHEKDQINKWLGYFQKSKKFVDWFLSVKGIVNRQDTGASETLSDQIIFKL